MKAAYLLAAVAAGAFATGAIAQTQNMQMQPAQPVDVQQSAQGQSAMDNSGYGGTKPMRQSGSASRDAWQTIGTSQACIVGLSCNVFQGQ